MTSAGMTSAGTFADFIAAVALPRDHVTLQRKPRSAASGGLWHLLVSRDDGSLLDVSAPNFAELVRRAAASAREYQEKGNKL